MAVLMVMTQDSCFFVNPNSHAMYVQECLLWTSKAQGAGPSLFIF